MIVTNENFDDVVAGIGDFASLDTETTGLEYYKDDELFSVIISDSKANYYFNFKNYENEDAPVLPRDLLQKLAPLLSAVKRSWFLQNAKFDMHMLARENLFIKGTVYDLMVMDRLIDNQHLRYNLDAIAARYGREKDDRVMAYIKEHKLTSTVKVEGISKEADKPHFDKVPFKIMHEYGEIDGEITAAIGREMLEKIDAVDASADPLWPKQRTLLENETKITQTLFEMEDTGVLVDVKYCREALKFYNSILEKTTLEFKTLTGLDFVKGTTVFEQVFESEKDKWIQTEKNEWCWDKNQLARLENPAAQLVLSYAEAKKQIEYFENFLFYADSSGVIRPSFNQAGTATSRFSAMNPNMQNLSSADKYDEDSQASKYPIRKAIIPREGYFFAMIDYAQSEYRIFLEYANARSVIREVLDGKDIHQANADIAKVSRKQAKTVGFGLLYGQGIGKLACSLFQTMGSPKQVSAIYKHIIQYMISKEDREIYATCSKEIIEHDTALISKAKAIKDAILNSNPEYQFLIKSVQKAAEARGFIRNFYGRRLQFSEKQFCYRALNHLIQSTCADMIKHAMVRISDLLADKKSRMLLQIHDELVFEIGYGEEYLLPQIKEIMEKAYTYKSLPQVAEISWSKDNLAHKVKWEH